MAFLRDFSTDDTDKMLYLVLTIIPAALVYTKIHACINFLLNPRVSLPAAGPPCGYVAEPFCFTDGVGERLT
jgi:hypothetical protein